MSQTLGERIRELREAKDVSLRELARQVEITPPFLSDVELGRRFPSDDVLGRIAGYFGVDVSDLQSLDNRPALAELKRLAESKPALGLAFRTVVDQVKSGQLTEDQLIERILGDTKRP